MIRFITDVTVHNAAVLLGSRVAYLAESTVQTFPALAEALECLCVKVRDLESHAEGVE